MRPALATVCAVPASRASAVLARLPGAAWVSALSAALAGVLLWPITKPGYLLAHDMVFTPQQPLGLAALGASSAPPRAVPVDAWVASAEHVVGGAVTGRLALLAVVIGAGVGTAALLRGATVAGRLAAATFAIWNPFVVERLALGQWSLLWAYAAFPWLVLAIAAPVAGPAAGSAAGSAADRRARRRAAVRWALRAVALFAASVTPTGGLVATATAGVLGAGIRRRRREALTLALLTAAAQLPWLVPAVVSSAVGRSDPAGVAAFASRSERGGVLLTLLSGGGIWDRDVVPASRSTALPWVAAVVVAGALLVGSGRLRSLLGTRLTALLALLGAGGFLLAALATLPGGRAVLTTAVRDVPGAGLLRDGQKWLIPLVVVEALCVGAAIEVIGERLRGSGRVVESVSRVAATLVAIAVPIVLLPDATGALRTSLQPVRYPQQWSDARALVRGADAATLPLGSYRDFPWAPGRTVYDPASRMLRVPTVTDDRLSVSGRLVAGEDPRARAFVDALTSGGSGLAQRLAALGIGWVVVEHRTPGPVPGLPGLAAVLTGPDLTVYRVPAPVRRHHLAAARVAAVLVGDGLAGLALLACLAAAAGMSVRAAARGRRRAHDGDVQDQGPQTGAPSGL